MYRLALNKMEGVLKCLLRKVHPKSEEYLYSRLKLMRNLATEKYLSAIIRELEKRLDRNDFDDLLRWLANDGDSHSRSVVLVEFVINYGS